MTQQELDYYISFNVSAIFTFFNRGIDNKVITALHNYMYNVYSIDEEGNEEYLYFVFHNHEVVYQNIDKISHYGKIHTDEYSIIKVLKWDWMSRKEWFLLKHSNYYEFRDIIYKNANRSTKNLQYHIITKSDFIFSELERHLDINIEEKNIFWKGFNREKETLILSKLTNMKVLGIKEKWLLEQIENSPSYEKHIYQKVIDNSIDISVPAHISLGQAPKTEKIDYESIYSKVKSALKETCGKEQYILVVKGSKYSLMCNYIDFKSKLEKVIKKYKLTDIKKVEQCLINHVKTLQFPMLKYYIDKDNNSQLVTDYETFVDGKIDATDVAIQTKSVDSKKLF